MKSSFSLEIRDSHSFRARRRKKYFLWFFFDIISDSWDLFFGTRTRQHTVKARG
jgi:hypothetical protein